MTISSTSRPIATILPIISEPKAKFAKMDGQKFINELFKREYTVVEMDNTCYDDRETVLAHFIANTTPQTEGTRLTLRQDDNGTYMLRSTANDESRAFIAYLGKDPLDTTLAHCAKYKIPMDNTVIFIQSDGNKFHQTEEEPLPPTNHDYTKGDDLLYEFHLTQTATGDL